jgi:hypothetical protein
MQLLILDLKHLTLFDVEDLDVADPLPSIHSTSNEKKLSIKDGASWMNDWDIQISLYDKSCIVGNWVN